MKSYRIRRVITVIGLLIAVTIAVLHHPELQTPIDPSPDAAAARERLSELEVKGRAPTTGYTRAQFGDGWQTINGCNVRNQILARDMENVVVDAQCRVERGTLPDPYTGGIIAFVRGSSSSTDVQIDHVVALSNAWQTGGQQLSFERRIEFSNDPLNLLAVDGTINQQKGDGDAATWLPPNSSFRCQYITRQIDVKYKYDLWVTPPEKEAMERILVRC